MKNMGGNMIKLEKWNASGWAWELEILVLFFIFIGFAIPLFIGVSEPVVSQEGKTLVQMAAENDSNAAAAANLEEAGDQMRALMGGLIVIGLYVGHLMIAVNSLSFISTPAIFLFSPCFFAAVTYYRLYSYTGTGQRETALVSGSFAGTVYLGLPGGWDNSLVSQIEDDASYEVVRGCEMDLRRPT